MELDLEAQSIGRAQRQCDEKVREQNIDKVILDTERITHSHVCRTVYHISFDSRQLPK